ncbi:putative CRC domain-containing protein TSO1 [Dioscorea sansibarensis]
MNTPERSKVGTPTSKVEGFVGWFGWGIDGSCGFGWKDGIFVIIDSISDLPKHEISSDNAGGNNPRGGTSNVVKPSLSAGTCSHSEAAVDNSVECSNSSCDLPQPLPYDCHSPHHNATPCPVIKSELNSVLDHTPDELVEYDEDCLGKTEILFATETELQDEQTEAEVANHNWDNLISNDADNLMIFDSSAELEACEGPGEKFHHDGEDAKPFIPSYIQMNVVGLKKTESDASIVPYNCEAKNVPRIVQSEGVRDQGVTGHRSRVFSENCENQAITSDRNQEMGHGSTSGISIACKVNNDETDRLGDGFNRFYSLKF